MAYGGNYPLPVHADKPCIRRPTDKTSTGGNAAVLSLSSFFTTGCLKVKVIANLELCINLQINSKI